MTASSRSLARSLAPTQWQLTGGEAGWLFFLASVAVTFGAIAATMVAAFLAGTARPQAMDAAGNSPATTANSPGSS
jgi:hypothetical protein